MHHHGAFAILLSNLAGTFAASCYPDRCLKRVDCGEGCVADCARHIAVTVTPPAVTLTSTTTVYSQLDANVSPIGPESTAVNAAPACQEVGGFPYWAAVCDSRERFRSACLCIGASITTATAPTPTSIVTETIVPSSPIPGPSNTSSSTAPTSSDASLPQETASSGTSPTGVVSSSVLLSAPTGGPSSTTGQTTASTTTDSVPVLLTVVPAIPGSPTRRKRRFFGGRKGVKRQDATGGFIDVAGTVETCSDGTPFNITTEGQLTSDGRAVGARFGDIFIPLAPRDDGVDISTEFVVVDSVLHWQNTAFSGGEAGFCQVGGGSGQVYATFAERDKWPAGCVSISIIVYKARQCRSGVIVPDESGDVIPSTPSATATVPSTAYTETETDSTLTTSASTISGDADSATSFDGVPSTIDPGQSMETSVPARSTAGAASTESPPFTQMSDMIPTTSTGQVASEPPETASSGLSPTTTPRSPELSSSSMDTSLFPASTESSITSPISVLSEATDESGSPTSVDMSGSPSSATTSNSPVSTESSMTPSTSTTGEETSVTILPSSVESSGSSSSTDTPPSPGSTESPITSSRSTSKEETSATAPSVSLETFSSSSSVMSDPATLGPLTSTASSGSMTSSPSSDFSADMPTQTSTASPVSSSSTPLEPSSSTDETYTYTGTSSILTASASSSASDTMAITTASSSTSVTVSTTSYTSEISSTSSFTSIDEVTTSSTAESETSSASESQIPTSTSASGSSEPESSPSMSSTSVLSATMTTTSSTDSEISISSSTESLSSSSDTFTISSTSSISDLPSTTESSTASSSVSSTSSSASASASASADPPPPPGPPASGHDFCLIIDAPGEDFDGAIVITIGGSTPPYVLAFKSYDDNYTPAAYFDLDGPTGRMTLSSSRSSAPLVPILPQPMPDDQTYVWLEEASLIDAQPDNYPEMTCVAPAGDSATNPATGNLIIEAAIECMATAPDEGRYYGGVSYGDNAELLMVDDSSGLTQYRFKVGYEDGACNPPS